MKRTKYKAPHQSSPAFHHFLPLVQMYSSAHCSQTLSVYVIPLA